MSDDILEQAATWRASGNGVAIATVVSTWGSSPRPVGSQLAVDGAVIKEALDAIATGRPRLLDFGVTNEQAWEVGLACGGKVQVFVERLD
jgi:xanthine/CO dehydrogenase XdhC/CoxF family maturation factor